MANRTCSIEGCDGKHYGQGYCQRHYWRSKRHGDPGEADRQRKPAGATTPLCAAEGCGREARGTTYCNRHYENLRRYGNPIPRHDRPLGERLREIGWTLTESGCWEWNGNRHRNGYGMFDAKNLGYVHAKAHRVVYEHRVGPIPDGLELRHTCDNPPCVNPEHLLPGTHAENMADMVERGRHAAHSRTECRNGHDLTLPGAVRSFTRRRNGRETRENECVECARESRLRRRGDAATWQKALG
jgi:HNH endonuclease